MSTQDRSEVSTSSDADQEARNIRRLQLMMSMVMSVISQDENLTIEEASELVAGAKRAALAMFPDKEFAYDILYKPQIAAADERTLPSAVNKGPRRLQEF